jgi:UDP-N-acetyl-2-amino-2-deoxyglucuronate dehydrogenase
MPTEPKPLTFALVGCGSIAETHAKALASIPSHARLVYCCDSDSGCAEVFAKRHGVIARHWRTVLEDPAIDAVSLCTPSGVHGWLAVEALRAGKHVVVEKPMDVSVESCDVILEAQEEAGTVLTVISQHRFDPASQVARGVIDRGEIGRLVAVDARVPWYRTQDYYDSGDWRGTWALDGGGALMNQGVHTVDLMLWLAGPVQRAHAFMRTAAHERIEVEDVLCGTLQFENGAIGTLMATTAAYPGFPVRLALHGTEGTIILEGDELHTLAIRGRETLVGSGATAHALQVARGGTRSATAEGAGDTLATGAWLWGDAHRAQFIDFCESVRDARAPLSDGRAGRAAVELITSLYASSKRGMPVEIHPRLLRTT